MQGYGGATRILQRGKGSNMKQSVLIVIWAVAAISVGAIATRGQDFLNGGEVEQMLVNHTFKFLDSRTGELVMVFVRPGGRFRSHFSGKYSDGKWWIAKDGVFFRQYVGQSRKRCAKLTADGDTVTFHTLGAGKMVEANLMAGNKLP